ncbi:MAG: rRNA maturation RNase YbeY [Zetaproteobacteria bacterium]|nr:rRNA maturation RNase YbeY [Zetaproteobacteria bacterium]
MSDPDPSYDISVYNELSDRHIPSDTIRELITIVLQKFEFKSVEVSVSFVTEQEIHRLNSQHRSKDKPTDVLSFPMVHWQEPLTCDSLAQQPLEAFVSQDELVHPGEVSLGDIVLCLAVAGVNAHKIGHALGHETAFLIVHSVLHLLGHDHEHPADEKRMLIEQRKIMSFLKEHSGVMQKMELDFEPLESLGR